MYKIPWTIYLLWLSVGGCRAKPGKYSWWFCKLIDELMCVLSVCISDSYILWLPFVCSSVFILLVDLCSSIFYHHFEFASRYLNTCCTQRVFFCLHGFILPKLLQKFQRDLELALLIRVDCVDLKFPELLELNSTAVEFSTATTKLQVRTSCDLDPERWQA